MDWPGKAYGKDTQQVKIQTNCLKQDCANGSRLRVLDKPGQQQSQPPNEETQPRGQQDFLQEDSEPQHSKHLLGVVIQLPLIIAVLAQRRHRCDASGGIYLNNE